MTRVRLDHQRATGRQRRRAVATEHGKGEREIAGRKHGDRSQRHTLSHQGRMPDRWRTCHGRVVGEGKRLATFGDVGKAAQLKSGAVEFAVQADRAQGGFLIRQRDELLALGFQPRRQCSQQGGAFAACAAGPGHEGLRRGLDGGVDVGRAGFDQRRSHGLPSAGVERLKCHVSGSPARRLSGPQVRVRENQNHSPCRLAGCGAGTACHSPA